MEYETGEGGGNKIHHRDLRSYHSICSAGLVYQVLESRGMEYLA